MMAACHRFRILRLFAVAATALAAFAVFADSEATCPDGAESYQSRSSDEQPAPLAPARDCSGRPCRTPLRIGAAPWAPMPQASPPSTLPLAPAHPLLGTDPAAPPTPPPIASRTDR